MSAVMQLAHAPAVRFLASGAFNTLATWLVYLALLRWLPYWAAYTAAYALGIVLAYGLNRWFVFRRPGGRLGPLLVAAIYIGQYFAGMVLVALWIRALGGPQAVAPLFAVAITLPATYLLNRLVFRGEA
jgi:putative flippase GtrA